MTIEIICNNKRRSKNGKHYIVLLSDCDKDLAEMTWTVGTGYAHDNKDLGYLHRVILSRILGRPLIKGEETDHKNQNKLDNQRENIRLASHSENAINRHLMSNNTSGFRGIRLQRGGKKWSASVQLNGNNKYLGDFPTKEEAAAAYDRAAKEVQGEFYCGDRISK